MSKKQQTDKPKLIAILGPTASGKSTLAKAIAQRVDGELVSADSRQLYRGMTIGTAKDRGAWKMVDNVYRYVLEEGVIEHLVDILDPDEEFSVAEYQRRAFAAIDDILRRGLVPILVGGTGLYAQAIIDHLYFPDVPPNDALRARLEQRSLDELQKTYAACDPVGAAGIDNQNKRRLIRAIEVCMVSHKPFSQLQKQREPKYDVLQLGMTIPRESLYQRIDTRVLEMMSEGLVDEVRKLVEDGVPIMNSAMTGIGYREIIDHLQGQISLTEAVSRIQHATRRLAKRQLTWFRRDSRIRWVKTVDEGLELVTNFLKKIDTSLGTGKARIK